MNDQDDDVDDELPTCASRLCERVATVGTPSGPDVCAWCAQGLASRNRRLGGTR
jgi:hypothetical protein